MSDRHDTEDTLKRFRHDPRARVKRSVMSQYEQSLGGGGGRPAASFWKRPVPLYAAAAALVVMVGFSFVAGRRAAVSPSLQVESPTSADGIVTLQDLEWSAAERDLL